MASLPAFVTLFNPLHPDLRVRETENLAEGCMDIGTMMATILCCARTTNSKKVGGVAFEEREKG